MRPPQSACCFVHFSSRLQIIPDAALRPDDQMMPGGGMGGMPGGAPGGRIRIITAQAK